MGSLHHHLRLISSHTLQPATSSFFFTHTTTPPLSQIFTLCFVFFFFQAEDGIRDSSVTGVQTCALPICVSEVGRRWVGIIKAFSPRPIVRPMCSFDDNAGRGFCRATCGDRRPDVAGDVGVVPRMNAVGLGRDDGTSIVGGFADRDIERDLAQKWNSAYFGLVPRAAVAE